MIQTAGVPSSIKATLVLCLPLLIVSLMRSITSALKKGFIHPAAVCIISVLMDGC